MELRFLPVFDRTILTDKWGLSPVCWLDPRLQGTPEYHPYTLLSAYYWYKERFAFPADTWVFGDSGGFSLGKQGTRMILSAEQVLRWQITSCSVGCVIDLPPYNVLAEHHGGYAAANFRNGLDRTVNFTKRALPYYEQARKAGTPFRWWGVIQGQTEAQLQKWWEEVSAVYPFTDEGEGWAVKVYPSMDGPQTARMLRFLKMKGIRRAHFLAATGQVPLWVHASLGPQAGMELISTDSATDTHSAANRGLFAPTTDGLGWTKIEEKTRDGGTEVREYMEQVCQCWSCHRWRVDSTEHPAQAIDSYYRFRLQFHNVLTRRNIIRKIVATALAQDAEVFLREQLGVRGAARVLQAFDGRLPHTSYLRQGQSAQIPMGTPRSLLEGLE